MLRQVTVIGCGLIGGSLVKGLRARAGARRVCAVDHAAVLASAASLLDDSAEPKTARSRELLASSDLVVLATPIAAIIENLPGVLDALGADGVVTDTGSVKAPVVSAAQRHARSSRFVGGHPMAGREVGGFDASASDLFERAQWFLAVEGSDASGSPDRAAADRVVELARVLGAEPVIIDAEAHDRAMAYVSHAPQLISSAVYAVAARAGVLGKAGSGFRDVTRISGGPLSTWRDIFETNRQELATALGQILEPLIEVRRRLGGDDPDAVAAALALLEEAQLAKVRQLAVAESKGEPR